VKFTIRKVILSIVPHTVIWFAKKKLNVNYLLFGPSKKEVGEFVVRDSVTCMRLFGMKEELGEQVVNGFTECYNLYLRHQGLVQRYLVKVKDCVIEPVYGWGITVSDEKLVFDSISNNAWIETYHPSYFNFKKNKHKGSIVKEIVSINILQGGEKNYWHFIHDLLGQVISALEYVSPKVPFLISKDLAETTYFKEALIISPLLASQNWIIRDHYIKADLVWFAQTKLNDNLQFFKVRDLLQPKTAQIPGLRKVFLVRSQKRIRFLSNWKAIESIAAYYGFEIIDTDGYSLQDQIALFSETKWLIGIHGAGLTNVMFRNGEPLHLLELLPADYIQPHYFWLSKGMGHSYDCLVGTSSKIDTSFEINPDEFTLKVKKLLEIND
jgi:hypothetical protein